MQFPGVPTRLPAVITDRWRREWLAPALVLAGIVALHAGTLAAGFINDDYLFLEQARRHGIVDALSHPGGLSNYFRPLSREIWFALWTPLAGAEPLVFHLAQLALFVAALGLLADMLSAFAPARGRSVAPAVLAGVLWYATLPLQRVNLLWVSCSQDLLALACSLLALAFFRRGKVAAAVVAFAAAALAKESALPLPAALFLWAWRVEGVPARAAARRVLPFALALVPWAIGEWAIRAHSASAAKLAFGASGLAAAMAHLLQTLAGVEHASGWLGSWADARPSAIAFAILAAAAIGLPDRRGASGVATEAPDAGAPASGAAAAAPAREMPVRGLPGAVPFAIGWLVCFALPVWPVVYLWSSYHYTLAAVGGAVLVTSAAHRITRWPWIALAGFLLWWHAAGVSAPAFSVREDPWVATSHFTPFYLERAGSLSRQLRSSLERALPRVATGTRFFFAVIPSWAGFQTGNGPSIRQLYRDDSLESHFYSEFSESTAARQPCQFLFWNGVDFELLHAVTRDPFFQVGTDLLLLGRPAGASWAFRRGLEEGGERMDHLYWLGWALLWDGQREPAERAWREWGAADDSSAHVLWLRKAKGSIEDGQLLMARRQLVEAVKSGIGRPEAHAMLGFLMERVNAKYALLETQVAADLNPGDWLARRDLAAGLIAVHLEDAAAMRLEQFKSLRTDWRRDSVAVRLDSVLAARRAPASGVAVFGAGGLR